MCLGWGREGLRQSPGMRALRSPVAGTSYTNSRVCSKVLALWGLPSLQKHTQCVTLLGFELYTSCLLAFTTGKKNF